MSTDVMILPDNIPAYLINKDLAAQMNADAASGIGTGMPPSIRIQGGKFKLVDSDGTETILRPTDLDATGEFLPTVILGAKAALSKAYYATAYDPNQSEAKMPDCWSDDSITPDASVANPVSKACAGCPMNAFGSGRNQAGQPTDGKACSDNKILAALYKQGIYQLKVPPASLKNWGVYVKNLTLRGVPVNRVFTYIGFDEKASFPVFIFRVGGFVPEQHVGTVEAKSKDPEVASIIAPRVFTAKALPAATVPVTPPAPPAPPADPNASFFEAPAENKPIKSPGRPRKNPESNVTPINAAVIPPVEPNAEAPKGTPTDAELAAMLGL